MNCLYCDTPFVPKTPTQKYCQHGCYVNHKFRQSERDLLNAQIHKTDYCWLWMGNRNKHGYGRIMIRRKSTLVHRLMYQLTIGEIPKGKIVRHYECDNPPCCNPSHLRIGTRKDNAQDAVDKNRHAHGETSYAKITEEQAIAIWHDIRTHQQIADFYNVSRRTVGHIKNGTTWAHLGLGRCPFRQYRKKP